MDMKPYEQTFVLVFVGTYGPCSESKKGSDNIMTVYIHKTETVKQMFCCGRVKVPHLCCQVP